MRNLTGAFSNLANDPKKPMAYIGREETRTQGLAGKQEETSEKTWMDIKMDLNETVLNNNAQPAGHMWSAEGMSAAG